MYFIGIDLTDPYAKSHRLATRAIFSSTSSLVYFDTWPYDREGLGMVPKHINGEAASYIVAVDGPQGLAGSPKATMRICEHQIGAAGKTPYDLPKPGPPYAGFIRGSVELFASLAEDYLLHGLQNDHHCNLIEVYPGATWPVMAHDCGMKKLHKKATPAGRKERQFILSEHGLDVGCPGGFIPSHDDMDAALAAYIAYRWALDRKVKELGEPPKWAEDVHYLREGIIIQLERLNRPRLL